MREVFARNPLPWEISCADSQEQPPQQADHAVEWAAPFEKTTMTDSSTTVPQSMYCRRCGYRLAGLSENRCPECGTPFDPADRRTYLPAQHSWQVRRWVRRLVTLLVGLILLVALFVAACIGWLFWNFYPDWKAEQPGIARVKALGGRLYGTYGHNTSLLTDLSGPFRYLHGRTHAVDLSGTQATDTDLAQLQGLGALKSLYLDGTPIADSGLVHVVSLQTLTVLSLRDTKVAGQGLTHLGNLACLDTLDLSGPGTTDATLRHLVNARPPRLACLELNNASISTAGLVSLKQLPALRSVFLEHTWIKPQDVASLRQRGQIPFECNWWRRHHLREWP
jgi:ribosomal protein L37E